MNSAIFSGINLYRNYPDESLRGTINDANNLWMLVSNRLLWNPQGLKVIKDNSAEAQVEKEEVTRLITDAKSGEHIIWAHSSHGSNNPDKSQKDGMQELLCCYDLAEKDGLWDTDTCITAKWIGEAIAKLHHGATMDLILDCCHGPQGSQLKELGLSYSRARFLRRPEPVVAPVKPGIGKVISAELPKNVALWCACGPAETSADAYIDETWQGAFTAAFLKAFSINKSRVEIIAQTRQWLKDNCYAQNCHLYCNSKMGSGKFGQ